MGAFNANSFPDGRRGRARSGDTSRVADFAASTLPVPGPGMVGRRFPQGSISRPLPGRSSGGTRAAIPTFTVVAADAKDKNGNPHPGRVRVYSGFLGSLRPTEMPIPDAVLPDGTDNHCYLTMQPGDNYITGKVLIDGDSGAPGPASVYRADSPDEADGTYVYWPIASVSMAGDGTLTIEQINTGNTTLFAYCSADGTTLFGEFNPPSVVNDY